VRLLMCVCEREREYARVCVFGSRCVCLRAWVCVCGVCACVCVCLSREFITDAYVYIHSCRVAFSVTRLFNC